MKRCKNKRHGKPPHKGVPVGGIRPPAGTTIRYLRLRQRLSLCGGKDIFEALNNRRQPRGRFGIPPPSPPASRPSKISPADCTNTWRAEQQKKCPFLFQKKSG